MKAVVLASVLVVLVSGCATEAERAEIDRERCLGLGFAEAGDGYKNCRLSLSLDRATRLRAAAAEVNAMIERDLLLPY